MTMRPSARPDTGSAFLSAIIPSAGRPDTLDGTVRSLLAQLDPPEEILICVPAGAHVRAQTARRPTVRVVVGPQGSAHQRNHALRYVDPRAALVGFFDDDVELAPDYLTRAREFLAHAPHVVLFWGCTVADGVKAGGISRAAARRILRRAAPAPKAFEAFEVSHRAYGCNMIARRQVSDANPFDEKLPLYAWLEDRDFAARCARFGTVGRYPGCTMVHLGDSSGRTSGRAFGYSQIANPVYLRRKGSMRGAECVWFVVRALIRNAAGALACERRVDRAGRLLGNTAALLDLARGRADPERIVTIPHASRATAVAQPLLGAHPSRVSSGGA